MSDFAVPLDKASTVPEVLRAIQAYAAKNNPVDPAKLMNRILTLRAKGALPEDGFLEIVDAIDQATGDGDPLLPYRQWALMLKSMFAAKAPVDQLNQPPIKLTWDNADCGHRPL